MPLRLDRAKANMAPPEAARWLADCGGLVSSRRWKFPDAFAGVTGAGLCIRRTGANWCIPER